MLMCGTSLQIALFPLPQSPPSKYFMAGEDFLKLFYCLSKGLESDGEITVLNNAGVNLSGTLAIPLHIAMICQGLLLN